MRIGLCLGCRRVEKAEEKITNKAYSMTRLRRQNTQALAINFGMWLDLVTLPTAQNPDLIG
jgi:hypothetical protein